MTLLAYSIEDGHFFAAPDLSKEIFAAATKASIHISSIPNETSPLHKPLLLSINTKIRLILLIFELKYTKNQLTSFEDTFEVLLRLAKCSLVFPFDILLQVVETESSERVL